MTTQTTDQAYRYLHTAYDLLNPFDLNPNDARALIDSPPERCLACTVPVAPWFDVCATCATGEQSTCPHGLITARGYCMDCGAVLAATCPECNQPTDEHAGDCQGVN